MLHKEVPITQGQEIQSTSPDQQPLIPAKEEGQSEVPKPTGEPTTSQNTQPAIPVHEKETPGSAEQQINEKAGPQTDEGGQIPLDVPNSESSSAGEAAAVEKSANQDSPIITEAKEKEVALSEEEEEEFKKCEKVIQKTIKSSLDAAKALRTINEKRLYRAKYKTFAAYVKGELTITKSYAYDLISFVVVFENLSTMADRAGMKIQFPNNERQGRILAKLNKEDQLKAWQEALEIAGKERVQVKHVKSAVDKHLGKKAITPLAKVTSTYNSYQWVDSRINKLASEDYMVTFDQPLTWGDELADLYCVKEKAYIKFIHKLEVSSAIYAIALKEKIQNSYIIIDGDINKCDEVNLNDNGGFSAVFCPHLEYFAMAAGIYVEFKGMLYEAGDLTEKNEIVWMPVTDRVLLGIFEKYSGVETQSELNAA